MKITYKEIADFVDKVEATIKKMKRNNPKQFEVLKMGAICKKYEISINDLENLIKFKKATLET